MTDTSTRTDHGEHTDATYRKFRFDCPYCEEVMQSTNAEAVKSRGETHVEDDHATELPSAFAETYGGEPCHNNCGYVFPVGVEEVAGFECPDCGYDNFEPFLQQYLYGEIDLV